MTSSNYHFSSTVASDPCHPTVIFDSNVGCPTMSIGPLYEFTDRFWYLIAFPILLIGIFLLFAGGRNPKATMFIIPTLAITCAINSFLWIDIFPSTSPVWAVAITFIVGLCMGAGLGFGAAYWPRLGIFTISCTIGAFIGACIYIGVLAGDTDDSVNGSLVFWMSTLVSGVFLAAICVIFYDFAVIIGSAFIGAFLFVRGVAMLIGGYPGEIEVIMNIKNSTFSSESMPISFFLYISLILLLFLVSLIAQIKHRSKHNDLY